MKELKKYIEEEGGVVVERGEEDDWTEEIVVEQDDEEDEGNGNGGFDGNGQQFISEEYRKKSKPKLTKVTYKAERIGSYQVVFWDKKGVKTVSESEFLGKKANPNDLLNRENDSKKSRKKKPHQANPFFNNCVESQSDTSSVPDEYPRTHPSVTEKNARWSDFTSGRRMHLMAHLSVKRGEFDLPDFKDKSDVLHAVIRHSNLYTSHDPEFDGFMTTSKKEERNHLWRNESIHPQRTYNRNNEVDPRVPHYEKDVDTSQKEMESHFGRGVGRDNKAKTFANRNSFSSVNDGCAIC